MARYFRLTSRFNSVGSVLQARPVGDSLHLTKANECLEDLNGLFVCAEADQLIEWQELLSKEYVCVVEFPDNAIVHTVDLYEDQSGMQQKFVEADATIVAWVPVDEWLRVRKDSVRASYRDDYRTGKAFTNYKPLRS